MLVIFSVLLFSSSLAKVLSLFVVNNLKVNLFLNHSDQIIPTLSTQLGIDKTFDVFNFVIFLALVVIIYGFNLLMTIKKDDKPGTIDVLYLAFGILTFLQTHFVRFSGTEIILTALFANFGYFFTKKLKLGVNFPKWIVLSNALLLGFYSTFFVRQLSTSILLVFGIILIALFLYQTLSEKEFKFVSSPWHILLTFGVFFSWNIPALAVWGIVSLIFVFFIKKEFKGQVGLVYSLVLLFLLTYNPNFYFGNIDTIEEGNWLAWLQRLSSGQVLYRDVAVFHPPLLLWGLDLFTKLFGVSVYMMRLYFHLLEIFGVGVLFLIIRKILKNKANIIFSMIFILSLMTNQLRNHVGIRLGLGLLALYFIFVSYNKNKYLLTALSGFVALAALFVSSESGAATIVACIFGLCVSSKSLKEVFKSMVAWFCGFFGSATVLIYVLWSQGALKNAIEQIGFYMNAYSKGFFNLAIPIIDLKNNLMWSKVDQYLNSEVAMWDFAFFSLGLIFAYLLLRFKNKKFGVEDKFISMLFVYCLTISRATLSRSDSYHLYFLLIPLIPTLVYVFESWQAENKSKYLLSGLWILIILIVYREIIQQKFINDQIFKIQSYANISQRYLIYENKRSQIALDIDSQPGQMNQLVDFLTANSTTSDKIFVFPWKPELYLLANRNNATSFDTPYMFFSDYYQNQMITQLESNKPKFIIYNSGVSFGNMTINDLSTVKKYITDRYRAIIKIGDDEILVYGKD